MIKEENAKAIAKIIGIDPDQFVQDLTAEDERELTLPEVHVFTPEALQQREQNIRTEADTAGYNKGKTAGIEMTIKEKRDALGLEFEGKTLDNLLEAYKTTILKDAKSDPDKRVEELKSEKTQLQQTIENLKNAHQKEIESLNGSIVQQNIDQRLSTLVEQFGGYPEGMTKNDVVTLIKSQITFSKNEDGKVVGSNESGVMKDDTLNPLSDEAIVQKFFADRKWVGKAYPNGNGGSDDFGDKSASVVEFKNIQTHEQLEDYCKKHGLQVQSDTVLDMISKHMSAEQRKKVMMI